MCNLRRTAKKSLLTSIVVAVFVYTTSVYAEKVTLNFKGADIKAVITSVADITGKNFIVDPRVKGKVTVISKRSLNKREVYQVFLSVLEVHGYTAIPSGRTIKIVPDADAKHSGMPSASDEKPGKGDEAVTRVLQIEHVTAAQLVPILRPLVPPQGHLAAYPQSNVLIISDRAVNIERLLHIIAKIDQPSSGEIEIVQLEYAAATDLVRVLTSLRQTRQKGAGAKGSKSALVADERTNSILIGGERAERLQLRAIISHLDTPSEVEGDTHVIYLRYANAKDLVPVLTGVGDSKKQALTKGKAKAAPRGQKPIFNIQADESSNALVITASPAIFRSLESVIRQLDVRRAQVLIESIIAEVSENKQAQLGLTWVLDGSGGDNPVGVIDFTGTASALTAAAVGGDTGKAAAADSLFSGGGTTLAFGRFNSSSFNWAGIIKALKGDSDTNVLSTPSLVTLDNEEAEIFIGEELSIPKGSFTNTGGGSNPTNPFTTFDRVPIGISLKVKPQINEGDAIRLDINQTIDSVKAGSAGAADVVTASRKINTSVMVDNGKVLVLGGLLQDNYLESSNKVPFLGDIPILGALFRSESVSKITTNLMIFLRPVIMRDAATGTFLTNSKYKYIRDLQKQMQESGVPLMADETLPMLPDLESFSELPPPFAEATKHRQQLIHPDKSVESEESLFEE
jgi:general secretion pathway protein D